MTDVVKNPSAQRLLVILGENLSALVEKGEVVARYYNPGNLFPEVHFILREGDHPAMESLQKMVGSAKVYIHYLSYRRRYFLRTFGWQDSLMGAEMKQIYAIVDRVKPNLIRTYNNFVEGYFAAQVKKNRGIPYVVSLHGVWDRDYLTNHHLVENIQKIFRRRLEKTALTLADRVIAVYKPAVDYAMRMGVAAPDLVYNAVSSDIQVRQNYDLSAPPKLVTINRQVEEKNPENIIRAIAQIDCSYLIIGDGPLHEHLQQVVREVGAHNKVTFVKRMDNAELCQEMKSFDLLVAHCDYWGISKSTIEAALAGLPIVLNHHPSEPIPDCEGGWLELCDNTVEGYAEAILNILENQDRRGQLGRRARDHARNHFDQAHMEHKLATIYSDCVSGSHS